MELVVSYLGLSFIYEFFIYFLSTYYYRQHRYHCVLTGLFDYNFPILIAVVVLSAFSHCASAFSHRHEKPTDPDDPLADQNIKDRYYGINDPVADKLLKRASTMPRLDPPEDKTITTLYIGGLGDTVTDGDLK